MASDIEVLLCYANEDERFSKELAIYLGALQRQEFFNLWSDHNISAGTEYLHEIDEHLKTAQIILLLISVYFINSDYCWKIQMQQAIERHNRGEAIVIPIIVRPVYFQRAPFAKLMPLPTNGKPIIDSSWHNPDDAFYDVSEGIRKAAEKLAAKLSIKPSRTTTASQRAPIRENNRLIPTQIMNNTNQHSLEKQQYKPGDRIRHSMFGQGVILKYEMVEGEEFVEVQFQGKHGKKRLHLDFAHLEKL